MSILKIILHRWNKTTKSHDTIHPETEVAQVTDWNQGIINTLASTALGTLVNTLTSDSLLATMIQKVLTATGVKYNIAQNGYVCLGSFFGGLIIQWVRSKPIPNINTDITLPMTMLVSYIVLACDIGEACEPLGANVVNQSTVRIFHRSSGGTGIYCHILVLGRQ